MGLFRTLKTNAKRALSGNWGKAIVIMLISMVPSMLINLLEYGIREVSGIPTFAAGPQTGSAFGEMGNLAPASLAITLLVSLLVFVILTPLEQGVVRWYYRRGGGEPDGVPGVFHYFETAAGFFRSLWLYFLIALKVCLWTMLLAVPSVLLFLLIGMASRASATARAFAMLLMLLWVVIVSVFAVIVSLRYFLAPYLLAEHPDYKARRAIREGVRLMRGHKGSVFLFGLSFIGWYVPILAALALVFAVPFSGPFYLLQVLGIMILLLLAQLGLCFYLVPYQNASFAIYARYLIQTGESGGPASYADTTREYRPEIDRYMEEQSAWEPSGQEAPDAGTAPKPDDRRESPAGGPEEP